MLKDIIETKKIHMLLKQDLDSLQQGLELLTSLSPSFNDLREIFSINVTSSENAFAFIACRTILHQHFILRCVFEFFKESSTKNKSQLEEHTYISVCWIAVFLLKNHKKDPYFTEGGADISTFSFHGLNLSDVDLKETDLRNIHLKEAYYNEKTIWPPGFDYKNSGLIGPEAQLKGENLSGHILSRLNIQDADLSYSYLSGVLFFGTNLTRSSLEGAMLCNANLYKANLNNCNCTRADLRGADLRRADLDGAIFTRALYDKGTRWPSDFSLEDSGALGPSGHYFGLDFSNEDLSNLFLLDGDFRNTILVGADLRNTCLANSDCSGADFSGADLRGANLRNTSFHKANLTRARLDNARYNEDTVWPQGFEISQKGLIPSLTPPETTKDNLLSRYKKGLSLQNADLRDANLEDCHLNEAVLCGADLTKAKLDRADMEQSNLSGANLAHASLHETVLSFSNLCNTDLTNSDLQKSELYQCLYNNNTKLPTGFSPLAHEMIFITDPLNLEGKEVFIDFRVLNLKEANLRKVDLQEEDLSNLNLEYADLREADLRGTNFEGANLKGVKLASARYDSNTRWPKNFNASSWDLYFLGPNTNLENANFHDSHLGDIDLRNGNLCRITIQDSDWSGANLREARLTFASIGNTSFAGVDIRGADFTGSTLDNVMFHEAIYDIHTKWGTHDFQKKKAWGPYSDLSGECLYESDFSHVDLSHAILSHADMSTSNFRGTIVTGANLEGANIKDSIYDSTTIWPDGFDPIAMGARWIGPNADLVGAELYYFDLKDVNLKEANLSQASLCDVNLEGANLTGANLTRTNFNNVNVKGANLKDAQLEGSIYDEDTVWPDGFVPQAAGAMLSIP